MKLNQGINDKGNFDEITEQFEIINNEQEKGTLEGYENNEYKLSANVDKKEIIINNISTGSDEKDKNSENCNKNQKQYSSNFNNFNQITKNNKQDFTFKYLGESIDFKKEEVHPDDFKIHEEGKALSENKFENMKNEAKVVKTPIIDNQNNDNYDAMSISSLGEKDTEFQNKDNKDNSTKDRNSVNKPIFSGPNQNGIQHNSSIYGVTEVNENNNLQDEQNENILLYEGTVENNNFQDPIPHGEMTNDYTYEEDDYYNIQGLGMNYNIQGLGMIIFPNALYNIFDDENFNQNGKDEEIDFTHIQSIESNH